MTGVDLSLTVRDVAKKVWYQATAEYEKDDADIYSSNLLIYVDDNAEIRRESIIYYYVSFPVKLGFVTCQNEVFTRKKTVVFSQHFHILQTCFIILRTKFMCSEFSCQ